MLTELSFQDPIDKISSQILNSQFKKRKFYLCNKFISKYTISIALVFNTGTAHCVCTFLSIDYPCLCCFE